MKRNYLSMLVLCLIVCATAQAATAKSARKNPFFSPSPLPFQAPPFDKIRDSDFKPALEAGMKQRLAEIDRIAKNPAAPSFANTIEAMERSGALLTRVRRVFDALTGSNTNPALQKIDAEMAPKLSAHNDSIYMNPKLFARVKSIYAKRDASGLDAQQKFLVERYYRDFVRAGAELNDADKAKLRKLNEEESTLRTEFRKKLLADTTESAIVISDRAELAGLSDSDIAAAAQEAKDRKLDGKWVLALQNTTQQPLLSSLQNRSVRERLFKASVQRGNHGGPNDTTATVARLAQLRAEKAKLLGYPSWDAYVLSDVMAKTPENAFKLLTDLVPAATARARDEAAKIQKVIDAENGGFKLEPWDWEYYAEKVRKAEYDLDESQVKPYFELNRVINDGVFFAANKLYGITFKERHDLPVYNP